MESNIKKLSELLRDGNLPMDKRIRSIWGLRDIANDSAVLALKDSMRDPSVLLAHEVAYCLGQMRLPVAIPFLNEILADVSLNSMVRHEAAEALGAIGEPSSISVLENFLKDPLPEIVETCQVALDLIRWKLQNSSKSDLNVGTSDYSSVDPAPPFEEISPKSVPDLKRKLTDSGLTIFSRYRALFALRNIGTEDAVLAIVEGFKDSSALFRHEIAYVLGQLQHPAAIPALSERLEDMSEHMMVRHEAAEAIGSIANDKSLPLLKKFAKDSEKVVKESCDVALDMHSYYNSEEFEIMEVVE